MAARGLVMVFTGNGKGKTTSALGMGLRAWGHGYKVLVLQFIKGGWEYGELKAFRKLDGLEMRPLGLGFIKGNDEQELNRHREAAKLALAEVQQEITSGKWDMIILDEVVYAISYGLVHEEDILLLIDQKPPQLHLVLTGRNASARLIDKADLVTEMKEIKHPYTKGIQAQIGVEF